MKTDKDLQATLRRIDGRGYKAYKDIQGNYRFADFTLHIDHVQGDPFAAPSRIRIQISQRVSQFPESLFDSPPRKIGLEDYVARMFARAIAMTAKGHRGSGKSGQIQIDHCGQEILDRTAVFVTRQEIEVRFTAGLPAKGRKVLGREAETMFFQEIPAIVKHALLYHAFDPGAVKRHVDASEDQHVLRQALREKQLVAFIANGAILPRHSGIDDRPLHATKADPVVPFQSPASLEVEFTLPNQGTIRGMGIPEGVALIVGGGFHGKSTVLNALERGVYAHIPDDGRETVSTVPEACKIRSEDGRRIEKVNITPFINNLPFGKSTAQFSTDNASGSTSQAANIMEAVEIGSRLLLIDEDTSATNFMIRDERMQELVAKEKEPITPFVDKVRQLYRDYKVSTILVMGGSGDYFDIADTVIMMDTYTPHDVTSDVREIVQKHATKRHEEGGLQFGTVSARTPLSTSFDASRGKRDVKIDVKGLHTLLYGTTTIDLSGLEQLVDSSQTRAIGDIILYYSRKYAGRSSTLHDGLEQVFADLATHGLDLLSPRKMGNYAMPRIFEVAAAINRMRTLHCA
ncbi:ATPase [candidate division KSB3 bacterium]|uniref:ATPase n=1 Tax=candidate division KSB3 bacterium TaxID=2044937 RepID=A0A9D5Q7C7_9BACT|nr:ATPase [candidate division KSB3 bacterium]MBD3326308.1 ATPase [candidate division KSB3 bacterium]